ncbi:MAG: DUF2812 domain-containing protein [Clostridiales bacterium]|nr:DUF2812 domain-containing protein [Clostridiales bacterium]
MIKKIKFYFAWHEKKEKSFLEDMSRQGYRLVKIGVFQYYFEPCEPENRIYEADFRSFDKLSEDEYLQLYLDAGWTLDAKIGGWYMFSRLDDGEPAVLYNDMTSLKAKYQRLLILICISGWPLYYMGLFIIPSYGLIGVSGYVGLLKFIIYPFLFLHFIALVKIFTLYNKFSSKLKE